jgi:tetratricopeptide (TPR) repeat protein
VDCATAGVAHHLPCGPWRTPLAFRKWAATSVPLHGSGATGGTRLSRPRRFRRGGERAGAVCFGGVAVLMCAAAWLGVRTISRNQDYQSELRMWRDISAKRPGNFRARSAWVGALIEEGSFTTAEAEAYGLLSDMQRVAKSPETHRVVALRAAEAYPVVQDQIAQCALGMNRPEEAILHLREALRANPSYAVARNNLATALMVQGQLSEAEAGLFRTMSDSPSDAISRYLMGTLRETQDRLPEAVELYQLALRNAPQMIRATVALARLRIGAGDPSVRDLPTGLALATDAVARTGRMNAEALEALAAALDAYGKTDDASRVRREASALQAGKERASLPGE